MPVRLSDLVFMRAPQLTELFAEKPMSEQLKNSPKALVLEFLLRHRDLFSDLEYSQIYEYATHSECDMAYDALILMMQEGRIPANTDVGDEVKAIAEKLAISFPQLSTD